MINPTLEIQNAIIDTLAAELNNAGTNPSGRLPTVLSVDSQWVTNVPGTAMPYIGVLPDEEVHKSATVGIRSKDYIITWQIVCAATGATQKAARAAMMQIIADGNGNGVCEVLEDPGNFSLGTQQTINLTQIKGIKYYDDVLNGNKQAGTGTWVSYGVIQYVTTSRVVIEGAIR